VISKVASFIQIHNLIQKNDIITAAVSGGRDSMALLYTLNILKKDFEFELHACHINHGLRGEDSDMDEELVRDECARLSVPLRIERLSGFDLKTGEDKLREARYDKFQQILGKSDRIKIATAHHLDDQLEKFLMRLAKGSYFKGLTAIPVARPGYIRPFLSIRRKEIDNFIAENNVPYREDFTNQDTKKLRNNIRLNLTPALISLFGEDFYKGFNKSINDLRESYADYVNLTRELFKKIVLKKEGIPSFRRHDYQQFSDNRKRLLIEYCISLLNPLNSNLIKYSFTEFERFVNTAHTGAVFHFGGCYRALINRDEIRFYCDEKQEQIEVLIDLNSSVEVFDTIITVQDVEADEVEYSSDKSVEYICGDRLRFPLKLRSWHYGDSFQPLGLRGRQKLSDFFINKKVAADHKKKILVLENNGELVWIVGMQIDNRYKTNKNCRKIFRLTQKTKKV
jgi:tRNA(Ile)-lysidine synthase